MLYCFLYWLIPIWDEVERYCIPSIHLKENTALRRWCTPAQTRTVLFGSYYPLIFPTFYVGKYIMWLISIAKDMGH